MRTAFYHPCALPPRDWLVFAALLWDRIHVSDLVGQMLRDRPEYVASNADAALLLRLITETTVCATDPPAPAQELPTELAQAWNAHLQRAIQGFEAILSQEEIPPEKRTIPSPDQLLDIGTAMNQVVLHDRFTEVFPTVDFFFADQHSFVAGTHSTQQLLVRAVEGLVPRLPSGLSIAQLESFRAETALQRQRCHDLMVAELARFEVVATEAEYLDALRRVTDVLREQSEVLEARCQQHKVDTVKKLFGVTLAAPAALQLVTALLGVPFLQPAAILSVLSIAGADYLAARERHQAELRSAPWAYLLNLKRLT